MSSDIFKILRCRCGWQRRDQEPASEIPSCPKCGSVPTYSKKWYMKVTVGGKRHIEAVSRHRRHVETAVTKAEAEIFYDKYKPNGEEQPLLSVAIENTYEEKWKRNKDGARSRARAEKIQGILGDIPLDQIDKAAYRRVIRHFEREGTGDSTINRYLASLKTVLRRHKCDYSFMEMFDEDEGRIYVLSGQEEQQIGTILRDRSLRRWPSRQNYYDEFADAVTILVDTGMRVGEFLRLPARDINLSTNLLTIWINKADKPRSVPMTDRVRAILEPRLDKKRIFDLTQDQIGQAWKHVRLHTGNNDPDYVPHALRHTCATRLLESGADIYTVKEWLGHKTIQTTLRYVHLMPGRLASAAASLQAYVNKSSTSAVRD